MKSSIKWFLIGLIATLVILFVWTLSTQLGRGGDTGISAILTSHSYEALIGMIALIGYTGGLALIIPTVVIAATGYIGERIIRGRRLVR